MIKAEKPVKKQTQQMVRRIVREFDPDRIILFGSHARGEPGPDSDDIPVAKDIIVSGSEEFQWRKDTVGTIEYPAVHEGKVLYARE